MMTETDYSGRPITRFREEPSFFEINGVPASSRRTRTFYDLVIGVAGEHCSGVGIAARIRRMTGDTSA